MIPSLEDLSDGPVKRIIEFVHSVGKAHNQEVYLVGGFVRDLIRKQDSEDLDFVVVGSPFTFADQLIEACQNTLFSIERVKEHSDFGTMTLCVNMENKYSLKIDVCTSRTEIYEKQAALPIVSPSNTILDDIKRRGIGIIVFGCFKISTK